MKRGKIAGYKIDKLADKMTKHLSEKIEGLRTQMNEEAKKVFTQYVPVDVLRIWKKYPEEVKTHGSVAFFKRGSKDWVDRVHFTLDIPRVYLDTKLKVSEVLDREPELVKFLEAVDDKRVELVQEKTRTRNQIKCVVSKLGTYSKLKKEFPEAYKILTEEIDGEPEPVKEKETNLCDSVEKLRASLCGKQ